MLRIQSITGRISERTKSVYGSIFNFFEEIVQWRQPTISSFYLLGVNAAFWGCVFYLDTERQLTFLTAIASCLFIFCALFRSLIAVVNIVPNTKNAYRRWFSDVNGESSFISTILRPLFSIAFLVEAYLLPMFVFTFLLFVQHPATITVMTGSYVSVYYLRVNEHEKACWTAYLTVLLMVLIPPWQYNNVTDRILAFLSCICLSSWNWLKINIFIPIWHLLRSIFYVLRYCICGYWIRPLTNIVVSFCNRIWSSIHRNIIDPLVRFLSYLKRQFIYWACGMWIPPLLEYLNEKKHQLVNWINLKIIDPITAVYKRIRDFCIYWFGGYWIPPFCEYCRRKNEELRMAFRCYIIVPIVAFFSDFKNNMKYIIFGHWIPPFLDWINRRVIDPIINAMIKIYYTADYIICGRWIPGLVAYLHAKSLEIMSYIQYRLRQFRVYLIDCAIKTKNYLRDTTIKIAIHIRTKWVIPFVEWLKETRIRIRHWFINHVLIPAWKGTKRKWRQFKYYIKHHVLYPALRRTAYMIIRGLIYVWKYGAMPVINVLSDYGAKGKDYAWINWLEPGVDWVAKQLPEKSPFVDDSDTELKDFLPSDEEEEDSEEEVNEDISNDQLVASSSTVSKTSSQTQSQIIRLKTPANILGSLIDASSSDEDDEFSLGLNNFPAVENADSDEEEEKSMIPRKTSSTSVLSSKQRQKQRIHSASVGEQILSTSTPLKPPIKPKMEPKHVKPPQSFPGTDSTQKMEKATDLEPDFEMIDHNDVDD